MRDMIKKLEDSPNTYVIVINHQRNDAQRGRVINWDPDAFHKICGGPDNGKSQSAFIALGHEIAHEYDELTDPWGTWWRGFQKDKDFDDQEERHVILDAENPTARYFGQPIRVNHLGDD